MHDHFPEEFGRIAHDLMSRVSERMLDDLSDQVQLGVKRYAKALARVKPGIAHSEAIEVIAKALRFKNWHDLTASIAKMDQSSAATLGRISTVVEVPLPTFDRPCSLDAERLELMAQRIGEMLGVSKQEVLDKVVAYVHEAPSFADLMARDPCLAGPCYEVVEQGVHANFVRMTAEGRAATHALWHELERLAGDWSERLVRLSSIVISNQLCFLAWGVLLSQIRVTDTGSQRFAEWASRGASTLIEFLRDVDTLDADDEDLRVIFDAARIMTECLIECHDLEAAHTLASDVLDASGGEDPVGLRFFLAASLTGAEMGEVAEDALYGAEILEHFTEDIQGHDPDAMLCVGMLLLIDEMASLSEAMSYLARANLATLGAVRRALYGEPEQLIDLDDGIVDNGEFSEALVGAFRHANPMLCRRVGLLMNTAAMRKAEREIRMLINCAQELDGESLEGMNADLLARCEIVSRASAMAPKLADAWEDMR